MYICGGPLDSATRHYTIRFYCWMISVGIGFFDAQHETPLGDRTLIRFGHGDAVESTAAAEQTLRFLLFAGKPLREPVAWGGLSS